MLTCHPKKQAKNWESIKSELISDREPKGCLHLRPSLSHWVCAQLFSSPSASHLGAFGVLSNKAKPHHHKKKMEGIKMERARLDSCEHCAAQIKFSLLVMSKQVTAIIGNWCTYQLGFGRTCFSFSWAEQRYPGRHLFPPIVRSERPTINNKCSCFRYRIYGLRNVSSRFTRYTAPGYLYLAYPLRIFA